MTYKPYLRLKDHPGTTLKTQKGGVPLYGGNAPLNFVNTLIKHENEQAEYLLDFRVFLLWCEDAGVIDEDYGEALDLEAYCYEKEAKQLFERVIITRMQLRSIIEQCMNNEPVDEVTEHHFGKMVKRASDLIKYQVAGNGLEMAWANIDEEMEAPLWMLILLTVELLQSDDSTRIRKCQGCSCLFVDKSKNRTRQWCDANACGSVFKQGRYYLAKRAKKIATRFEPAAIV